MRGLWVDRFDFYQPLIHQGNYVSEADETMYKFSLASQPLPPLIPSDLIGRTISSAVERNLHRYETRPFPAPSCEGISSGRGWLARLVEGCDVHMYIHTHDLVYTHVRRR